MTVVAIVLAAALAIVAVLWVARPLLVGHDDGGREPDDAARERLRLLEARDRSLAALKELEFDHRTGKISDADYEELVRPLRQEAAEALAALDAAIGPEPAPPVVPVVPPSGDVDRRTPPETTPASTASERQEQPR